MKKFFFQRMKYNGKPQEADPWDPCSGESTGFNNRESKRLPRSRCIRGTRIFYYEKNLSRQVFAENRDWALQALYSQVDLQCSRRKMQNFSLRWMLRQRKQIPFRNRVPSSLRRWCGPWVIQFYNSFISL